MFRRLGTVISRTWPICLLAWAGLYALLYTTAPDWNDVAQDREFGFLPDDMPTRQGYALFKRAFPDDKQASNIVLVINRDAGQLTGADREFVRATIRPALLKLADEEGGLADDPRGPNTAREGEVPIIAAIRTLDDPGSGVLLVSEDRMATLVLIDLTTELLEQRNWPLLDKIEAMIARWRDQGQVPAGLHINLIGSATVGRDLTVNQRRSADATQFWTVAIVIGILLVVYRAPLLALIPLVTVFIATHISLQLLAHLSRAGVLTVFDGIETYLTVILYGTGVDYCLFLISRFQEEASEEANWGGALAKAIGKVGPAVVASAATVMFGIGMMAFAKFGKFHHAGIAIAVGIGVTLCVVLTFTTALLRLAGRWVFWPRALIAPTDRYEVPPSPQSAPWFSWETIAQGILRRPALIWLTCVALMAPFAIGGMIYGDKVDYDFVRRLPPDAASVAGTEALQKHFPAGAAGIITVLIYHPDMDFLEELGKGPIALDVLSGRLHEQQTPMQLADIRSVARPLGTGWASRQAAAASLEEINRGLEQAAKYYVSQSGDLKGHVTRFELTMLQNPMSREGIASLDHIEEVIRGQLYGDLRNAKLYYLGVSADMRDLRQVTGGDQLRIQLLVVACVLVILIVVLRRPGVAVYLILSVLFSYFATLGTALLFFWWWEPGFVGLDWKTPIFLFTILVAIGEDYNIFLMTRVVEEQKDHGPIQGIQIALVRTGRIITTCGLIMTGAFAALLFGSTEDLRHLGFALAVGVLVDTFVVRPILVPAFLTLLERGRMLRAHLSDILAASGQDMKSSPPSDARNKPAEHRQVHHHPQHEQD